MKLEIIRGSAAYHAYVTPEKDDIPSVDFVSQACARVLEALGIKSDIALLIDNNRVKETPDVVASRETHPPNLFVIHADRKGRFVEMYINEYWGHFVEPWDTWKSHLGSSIRQYYCNE